MNVFASTRTDSVTNSKPDRALFVAFPGSRIESSVKMKSSAVTGFPSLQTACFLMRYVSANGCVCTSTRSTSIGSNVLSDSTRNAPMRVVPAIQ